MRLVAKVHRWLDKDIVFVTDQDLDDPVSRRLRHRWSPDDHTQVAMQLLTEDDFFLDLGANYGMFCLPVSLATGAKCLAVEALESNVPVLSAAIQANSLGDRIDWTLAAVTERSGEVRISGQSAYGTVGTGRRVLSYSLDDLMTEFDLPPVRLIKMDIEGCELPALRGASRFLDANPDATFVFEANAAHCYRTGSLPQDLLRFFEGRGYLIYLCRAGRLARRTSRDFQESGVSNYIASKTPIEVEGFDYSDFDAEYRIAQTIRSMTEMKPGYCRSAIQQMHLAPDYIRDAVSRLSADMSPGKDVETERRPDRFPM